MVKSDSFYPQRPATRLSAIWLNKDRTRLQLAASNSDPFSTKIVISTRTSARKMVARHCCQYQLMVWLIIGTLWLASSNTLRNRKTTHFSPVTLAAMVWSTQSLVGTRPSIFMTRWHGNWWPECIRTVSNCKVTATEYSVPSSCPKIPMWSLLVAGIASWRYMTQEWEDQ